MKSIKLLSLTLICLIGISSTGCSAKERIVIKYKEKKVPVKCIVPNVDCNRFKNTLDSQQEELLLCNKELRRAIKVCQ